MHSPTKSIAASSRLPSWLGPAAYAFLATLMALPVNAGISLPSEPLITSSRVPPNILFILDDSSSMTTFGGDVMENPAVPSVSGNAGTITDSTYIGNTVFYDPTTVYEPWLQANGTPMTGGTSYGAAYSDISLASGTTTNLQASVQTFYVPKDVTSTNVTYLSNSLNYYRFQILTDGRIIRSEWLARSGSSPNYNNGLASSGCTSTNNSATWRACALATPTGRDQAVERANFAIWYSYHRSRMKAAKAGAGRAFDELGSDVRVGFRTINNLNGLDIPVTSHQGLFTDLPASGATPAVTNRSTWYSRLYAAGSASGTRYTPLRSALRNAGDYFSSTSQTGPYATNGTANEEQYSCRQNFAILTTDGYWNRDTSGLAVGDADGQAGPNGYVVQAPYRDGASASRSNTLADVAMHYWKTDLRTNLTNNVPTSTSNPASWQHMVTFGISIGLQGTINPAGPYPGQAGGLANWPDPETGTNDDQPSGALGTARIDDLLHASLNGRGTFLAATNPTEFANGLTRALGTINDLTGSFSNVAASSTRLDTGTQVFQAKYLSGQWTGELSAYNVTTTGTPPVTQVSTSAAWTASAGIPAVGSRKVFTRNDANTTGTTFPTPNQTTGLARTVAPSVTGVNNAAYIKGDTSKEMRFSGGTLRSRTSLLGDIVSSSPAYVKETNTLYVGANDGMLHAIDAANGVELFAYVPRGINLASLGTLSDPDYSHRFFVDGPIVVSSRTQTPNSNILVGALGKGGKGVFALDVTTPGSFANGHVLWERNADDNVATTADNNMGLVQGRPIIATLNNGDKAVIFGNGINSTGEKAVLFVYNLTTGALIAEIDTQQGSAAAPNGLSAPAGWDADGNGTLDLVYAGDMLGNVWRFDLSSATPSNWESATNRTRLYSASYPATPAATAQHITSGVTVAMHPTSFKPWVFFGTGRLMTVNDIEVLDVQSMYGIVDENATVTRSQLQARTIVVTGTGSNGRPVRGFEAKGVLGSTMKGWYLDLKTPPSGTAEGERVVSDPQIVGDVLVFASVIPENNACLPDGRGYINAMDAFTGTSSGPAFFDLDGDGNFDEETLANGAGTVPVGSVDLGVGMPTLPNLLRGLAVVGGSSGTTNSVATNETRNVGRVSWREVLRN